MDKKTILLLSDDIRTHSGVATVSRKVVEGTVHKYNWYQLGAVVQSPDNGKIFDVSEKFKQDTGVSDAKVIIESSSGYGDANKIRRILADNQIDAILHYTDPRYWEWLYNMEYELRTQGIPILYYHVWDNYPAPKYNTPFYKSCDSIMTISQQTHAIVKELLNDVYSEDKYESGIPLIKYIPHGIDPKEFKPLTQDEPGEMIESKDGSLVTEFDELPNFKKAIFGDYNPEFVILFNSRNVLRKHPADIILAYNNFMDSLNKEEQSKVALLLHTAPIDKFGTNLYKVVEDLCKYPVYFSSKKLDTKYMNMLYNIASITISASSAEGFGLSTAESIMAGTPILATVTGGLQDQMGFVNPVDSKPIEDFKTNHDARYGNTHGSWAFPMFPIQTLTGSLKTPYIYDDVVGIDEIRDNLKMIYENYNHEDLKKFGLEGRNWMLNSNMTSTEMINGFIDVIDQMLENFEPINKIRLIKVNAEAV